MIFIDRDQLEEVLGTEKLSRAETLTDALLKLTTKVERDALIDANQDMWKDAKKALRSCSHEKCWYCESKQVRSDNAVDHFRPKKRVSDSDFKEGYWWLAFTIDNFRFACTFCNSRRTDIETGHTGGKGDNFPLVEGSPRAASPSDDLTTEQPALIDPCSHSDVSLLWFDDEGKCVPNPHETKGDSVLQDRVERSKDLYHLDHDNLVRERKGVYRSVRKLVKSADFCYARWRRQGDYGAKLSYDAFLLELRKLASPRAEYAATARCALMGLRGSSGAADAVLRFT